MNMLLKLCVLCIRTVVVIAGSATIVTGGQDVVLSDGAFRQATSDQKKKILNDVALQRVVPRPSDLQALLRVGFEDDGPEIRARAFSALAARAGGVRLCPTEELRERWRSEREALLSLRSHVVAALEDPDEGVRQYAILALMTLDYEVGGSTSRFLTSDTTQRLADAFRRESRQIRGLILQELSLTGDDSPVVSDLMMLALQDQSVMVRHAVWWLATVKRVDALPRLAELLTHPDQHVRLAVSQTLAAYRELAMPYLPQVEEAAQAETDPIIKKTLEGARSVLMQVRAVQQRPK